MHFFIGEKEVHQMPRAKVGPDGIAGVRVGKNLNVQVDALSVKTSHGVQRPSGASERRSRNSGCSAL